jgi:hypothetical protein
MPHFITSYQIPFVNTSLENFGQNFALRYGTYYDDQRRKRQGDRMSKGAFVLVRACSGKPLARRIWRESERGVLICRDEGYMAWESTGEEPRVAELKVEAVFIYEHELLSKLESAYHGQADSHLQDLWQQAKPYYNGCASQLTCASLR